MTRMQLDDPKFTQDVLAMVAAERAKALSRREWTHRLAGLGVTIEGGHVIALHHGRAIAALPPELA